VYFVSYLLIFIFLMTVAYLIGNGSVDSRYSRVILMEGHVVK